MGTHHERECQNIQEGLEDAREFWLEARAEGEELEADRQMLAIDALLDTGLRIGMWAVGKTIDNSAAV